MGSVWTTVFKLREEVAQALADTINFHRESRTHTDSLYVAPEGTVTDEEIDHFLTSNPLISSGFVDALVEPGLLGFEARAIRIRAEAYDDFRAAIADWAANETWLAADDPLLVTLPSFERFEPTRSQLWLPDQTTSPGWLHTSPSAILAAQQLIEDGRLLSELDWREFERLIAELLERERWTVELMQGTKDGGIDVVAKRADPLIGHLKAIWQAKRYKETRKVQVAQARELSGIVEREGATKGVLVTTSSFTRGAINWVRQDEFKLSVKDSNDVKEWIARHC